MKALLAAMTALALGACAATTETPMAQKEMRWPTLDGRPPLVIAHRGASGYRPEHTLEAYKLAIEQGADVIEPDLVFTKDGVLVARHDRYLSTTTDIADRADFADRKRANPDPAGEARDDWWVEDFTLAELKTLRARQPFPDRSKEFDDRYEIPTFAEVLALASEEGAKAGRPVGVYPETKHPGYFASIGHDFADPLLDALAGFTAGPVFIQSFEPEILKRLKGRTGAALVQLVFETSRDAGPNIPLEEIATYADGVGPAKGLLVDKKGAMSTLIREAHSLGLMVHPWTLRDDQPNSAADAFINSAYYVNGQEEIRFDPADPASTEFFMFFLLGVDGAFTDFPDTALAVRDALKPYFTQK